MKNGVTSCLLGLCQVVFGAIPPNTNTWGNYSSQYEWE